VLPTNPRILKLTFKTYAGYSAGKNIDGAFVNGLLKIHKLVIFFYKEKELEEGIRNKSDIKKKLFIYPRIYR
jgi:hypothetical protein